MERLSDLSKTTNIVWLTSVTLPIFILLRLLFKAGILPPSPNPLKRISFESLSAKESISDKLNIMVELTPVSNKKVSFVPLTSTGITTKLLINLNDILSFFLSSEKKKPL